jgi:hypothetical protein
MIQRIQTIYLLGATILLAICLFTPIAQLVPLKGDTYTLVISHLIDNTKGLLNFGTVLVFLLGWVFILCLLAIIQYKNRKRQMTTCITSIVLCILLTIAIFYQIHILKIAGSIVFYKLPIVFPLISAILLFLAWRGVKKDDELVRSYDRLR